MFELILPTAILPITLSCILLAFRRFSSKVEKFLPLLWLPSVYVIVGWPELIPQQASDWVVWFIVISTLLGMLISQTTKAYAILLFVVTTVTTIAITWPIWSSYFVSALVGVVSIVMATGITLISSLKNRAQYPVLTLWLSSTALSVVIILGGSLLIGQLVAALAGVIFIFAVAELVGRLKLSRLAMPWVLPLMLLYLLLLLVGFLYVDLTPLVAIALLLAPLPGYWLRQRWAIFVTLCCVIIAITWVVIHMPSNAYY